MANKEKWITSSDDQINYLESSTEQSIGEWVEDGLKGMPFPIWIDSEREFHEYLINLYEVASNKLRRYIDRAIANLINSWKKLENKEFLFYLIYLCGRLRISNGYKRILSWVHEGKFKNEFAFERDRSTGKDLHLHCLMAAGPQVPLDDKIMRISCIRDIEIDSNPNYFNICYRILYSNYTNYQRYLIKYFHKFVELCSKGYISFTPSFYYIYKHDNCRIIFLKNLATDILNSLTSDLKEFLLRETLIGGDTKRSIGEIKSIAENNINIFDNLVIIEWEYLAKLKPYAIFIRDLGCYLSTRINIEEEEKEKKEKDIFKQKTSEAALTESSNRPRDYKNADAVQR